MNISIQSFKDLLVWQRSIEMVIEVYEMIKGLPNEERYGLISQMRRSAVSVPSNIAEGYKRKNRGEYLQFLSIADASAAELETQLIITNKVYKSINTNESQDLLIEVQKMLYSMMQKLSL